ncbi:MAG: recombination-associated protein RdgC [Deltaproteobacteria bacterium]|jgi:DNA recombination-dependent growth factor C|nr:recombination-associated protein RdgC [Deltaproteobacteria bacterium]
MGFLKGSPTVTRYRIVDALPEDYTQEFIGERLRKHCFQDIEDSAEESSSGWAELLDGFSCSFREGSYSFGPNYAFSLRLDQRRLSSKILSRYYAMRETEFAAKTGRRPNSVKRKELKEALRNELLRKTLLATDLYEVVWLTGRSELWLAAAGEKLRSLFEDHWARTFGLSLRMLVPVTIGLELLDEKGRLRLLDLKPSLFQ